VIAAIYQYAFGQVGANVLEVGTPLANEATLKFLGKIGFKRWGIRPHAYGRKQHQACFTLSADAWRRSIYYREV
jgi:RimJ/RimL family protein N-acetyltransferase